MKNSFINYIVCSLGSFDGSGFIAEFYKKLSEFCECQEYKYVHFLRVP